eukprot:SAG11_NODE_4253_length_1985_cov_1.245493_2_plen_42_part_00
MFQVGVIDIYAKDPMAYDSCAPAGTIPCAPAALCPLRHPPR